MAWVAIILEILTLLPPAIKAIMVVVREIRKKGNGHKIDRKSVKHAVARGVREHAVRDQNGDPYDDSC